MKNVHNYNQICPKNHMIKKQK